MIEFFVMFSVFLLLALLFAGEDVYYCLKLGFPPAFLVVASAALVWGFTIYLLLGS